MSFSTWLPFKSFAPILLIVSLALPSVCMAEGPEFDVRAVPIKTPPPDYPYNLKRDGISGVVAVKVFIDETGSVSDCSVSKSSNPDFNQAAMDAVKKWKFKPAQKDGSPVKSKLLIPIQFRVDE